MDIFYFSKEGPILHIHAAGPISGLFGCYVAKKRNLLIFSKSCAGNLTFVEPLDVEINVPK